jgi:hypothetical protein
VPSPTALTLDTLRRLGYTAAVVERFIVRATTIDQLGDRLK